MIIIWLTCGDFGPNYEHAEYSTRSAVAHFTSHISNLNGRNMTRSNQSSLFLDSVPMVARGVNTGLGIYCTIRILINICWNPSKGTVRSFTLPSLACKQRNITIFRDVVIPVIYCYELDRHVFERLL